MMKHNTRAGGLAQQVKARPDLSRCALTFSLALFCAWSLQLPVYAQPSSDQLPEGGQVSAGQATINQHSNVMTIDQASEKAIINWQAFNVGQDATVNFNQPGSNAATLNRVLDSNPSQIFGRIMAPGQVILINPNGAYFAPTASVDVGGLIATTHELADQDFLNGHYQFKRSGSIGKIINDGELKARLDGYIALMAPEVRNQGVIIAEHGTVVLTSGEHIRLDFGTGSKLTGITVTEQDIAAHIENKHAIYAEGGLVILSSKATAQLRASVIKNSGQIVASAGANTVSERGGRIILEGDTIEINDNSRLLATGPKGGGEILVGIDWQGEQSAEGRVFENPDQIHQATKVTIESQAKLDASTTGEGKGGTVVVWSGVKNAELAATVDGETPADGVDFGGDIKTLGHIRANGGLVALIGNRVSNQGTIEANNGNVALAAGDIVSFDFNGDGLMAVNVEQGVSDAFVENRGLIQADGGFVMMTTQAQNDTYRNVVNNDGLIQARTLQADSSGRIMLMGGMRQGEVIVSGTLDASAPHLGDGGFIETSAGNVRIQPDLLVTTLAANGQTGEWLIDPVDITVAQSGGNITGSTLADALQSNNVTLDTSGSACTGVVCDAPSAGNGDIFIHDNIVVTDGTQDTTLTLRANRHIDIADGIEISRTGAYKLDIDFQADIDENQTGNTVLNGSTALDANGGDIRFNRAVETDSGATVTSLSIDAGRLNLRDGISVKGDLLARAPIDLEADSDITITSIGGSVGFLGTINGDANLTLDIQSPMTASRGMAVINAVVGGTTHLRSLTTTGDGTIFINANITTSGAQTYNNDLYIGSGPLTQFLNNSFQSNTVGDGVSTTDSSAFRRTDIDPNNIYENVIEGWTLYLNRVVSGEQTVTEIAGFPMPTILGSDLRFYVPEGSNKSSAFTPDQGDTIRLPSGTTQPDNRPLLSSSFGEVSIKVVEDGSNADSTQSLQLNSTNMWLDIGNGFGVVRGPFVVSNTTAPLSAGDSVSFDWKAEGNFDDFAVYAYLLNPDTGHAVELLNAIGGKTTEIGQATIDGYNDLTGDARGPGDWSNEGNSDGWITSTVTLADNNPDGNYHFVFISGTWDADGGRQLSASMNIDNIQTTNATVQALFNRDDPLPGLVTLTSDTQVDFEQANIVTLQKDLEVIVPNTDIAANLTGPGTIEIDSANAVISGDNSHAATIISSGDLTLQYDELPSSPPSFEGAGVLNIRPSGDDFTAPIDLTNWDFGSGLEEITIGQATTADGDGDQSITLGDMSATGPISIFGGDITIDGGLSSDGAITLQSSGAVTDGVDGSITASELLLSGGAVTLDSVNNNVDTLAAEGVSSLTFVDNGLLTIGVINDTEGIDATGAVSVTTLTGDLNVIKNITTTDDTTNAIVLNAGENVAAGTATGGDIQLANGVDLTSGPNGQILLYTGSVDGSTGVTELVGSGSGNFRYNSDETSSNFVTPLDSTGINAIYREQPTAQLNITSSTTITYGDEIPFTASGVENGDEAFEISNQRLSTAGFLQANADGYNVTTNLTNLGYEVIGATSGNLIVNPRQLSIDGASGINKVYDGTTIANVSGGSISALDSDLVTLSDANAGFASKDVGENIAVTTSFTISGADAGNYTLVQPTLTANITPATLTVTANNDAKFVTQEDPEGYAGVSFAGFVNGETESVLKGAATVTRTNVGTNAAGDYSDVLQVSGLTSTNYTISPVAGDFTIVGAEQLLVRVEDVVNPYGTVTTYEITSVEYLAEDNTTIVDLTESITRTGNDFRITDSASGQADFTLAPVSPSESNAGLLKVGSYQLGAEGISTTNEANFSDTITVVGFHQVNTKELTPSVYSGVSKVYDGTTDMAGVSIALSEVEKNDLVTINGAGAFSQSDVGMGLSYTIGNLVLSGDDAANYHLAGGDSFTGANGEITQRDIVLEFTGIDKVYDGNTNATVDVTDDRIPGDILTITKDAVFEDKNVGTNKTIDISNIVLGGADGDNYNLVSTTDSTNADITRLDSVTWAGGATGNWFDPTNWDGQAVPDLSNVANVIIPEDVTVTFNNSNTGLATPASTDETSVNIDSLGSAGSLQHVEGFLTVGSGGVTLATYTQNGGTLTNSGTTVLNTYSQAGGSFNGTGGFTTESFSQTGGETGLTADFTVNQDFSQATSGSVTVNGNTDITDNSGGVSVGNLNTTGTTSLTSTDGNISQASDTTLVSGGTTTLTARDDEETNYDITLNGTDNDFSDAVTITGAAVTVNDTDNLQAILDASGATSLTAGGDITVSGTVAGTGSDLVLDAGGQTAFGVTTVDGVLTSTTGGEGEASGVFQTGALSVQGDASFVANTGTLQTVSLTNQSNDFQGTVSFANANDGSWTDIELVDGVSGLVLGDASVNGLLDVSSGDGAVTQTAGTTISVSGQTTLSANKREQGGDEEELVAQNITLDSENDFAGVVSVTGADITLSDTDNLQAILDASGTTSLTAGGDITVSGTVAGTGSDLVLDAGGQTTFGATTVDGDLSSTTGGEGQAGGVSQTGELSVGGDASFIADSEDAQNADLTNADNNFQGTVSFTNANDGSWNNVSVTDTDALTLGNVTANDLTAISGEELTNAEDATIAVTNNADLSGTSIDLGNQTGDSINFGSLSFSSTGSANTAEDSATELVGENTAGSLTLSSTGAITNAEDATLAVTGNANLSGTSIDLGNQANDFGGVVNASAEDITLNNINELELGDVQASGELDATTKNDLTLSGEISADSLKLESTEGGIKQTDGTVTVLTGPSELTAQGDITLESADNAFVGKVTAGGDNIKVMVEGDLEADITAATDATLNVTGNLGADIKAGRDAKLDVGGSLTVDLEASRNADLSSGDTVSAVVDVDGDGTLTSAGNMTVSGKSQNLTTTTTGQGSTTALGPTQVKGKLSITTMDGDIIQFGRITVQETTTAMAGQGDIALEDPNNDFVGIVFVSGQSVRLVGARSAVINPSDPNRLVNDYGGAINTKLTQTLGDIASDIKSTSAGELSVDTEVLNSLTLDGAQSRDGDNTGSFMLGEPDTETRTTVLPVFLSAKADISLHAIMEVQDRGSNTSASFSSAEATDIPIPNVASLVVTKQTDINVNQALGIDETLTIKVTEDGDLLIEVPRSLSASDDEDLVLIGVAGARQMGVTVEQLRSIILVRD